MRVTIYDVARKAGVGIGTVSRVINDSPQISPKTREKVLRVIKELKYQPSVMAQGLARRRTNTIACIVPFFTGYFYFEMLNGVQQALSQYGYDLILYSVDQIERKDQFLKKALRERRVDGVLLSSMAINDSLAEKFVQSKLPIILVDAYHPLLDSICVENKEGAFQATEHLIKLGHKKIGMINGNLRSNPAKTRLEGFMQALGDNNLIPDKRAIFHVNDDADPEIYHNDGFNKQAGIEGVRQILSLAEDRPTAIFAASDIQAAGAMQEVKRNRLRIPKDIAIIGFDGIELSEYLGLTTMKQPMREMGEIAVDHLIGKINNGVEHKGVFHKLLHPKLIIRDTCGTRPELKQAG
ncbi:MAG: LacI family transcriptional regulator [Calditrichaeota bacterium]|nr:LacI family transcriptional regulator [Calditrichota bacterium]